MGRFSPTPAQAWIWSLCLLPLPDPLQELRRIAGSGKALSGDPGAMEHGWEKGRPEQRRRRDTEPHKPPDLGLAEPAVSLKSQALQQQVQPSVCQVVDVGGEEGTLLTGKGCLECLASTSLEIAI